MKNRLNMNTTKDHRCPKRVLKAVMLYARAVRCVEDLAELPFPDPQTEYHAVEYLPEMETLLLEQLLTAVPSELMRDTVLCSAGLEHLQSKLHYMAEDWEETP